MGGGKERMDKSLKAYWKLYLCQICKCWNMAIYPGLAQYCRANLLSDRKIEIDIEIDRQIDREIERQICIQIVVLKETLLYDIKFIM